MRAPGGKKSVWAGLGRDDGSARPATARGRAAQLFAGFALRGARLIDDADHDTVIDTVRDRARIEDLGPRRLREDRLFAN
jgi:hypothetical protein